MGGGHEGIILYAPEDPCDAGRGMLGILLSEGGGYYGRGRVLQPIGSREMTTPVMTLITREGE